MCVKMQVEGVDREIVAQSLNIGFDVSPNQFDLQMGAGGTGAYNTCAGADGAMFPGKKDVWGAQYGGVGSKADCSNLPRHPRDSKAMQAAGDDLVKLCEYSFEKGVRGSASSGSTNPSLLSIARVACPAELVNLTQLRRTDDPPETAAKEMTERRLTAAHKCSTGTTAMDLSWCLTRMMDCRKPSGSSSIT